MRTLDLPTDFLSVAMPIADRPPETRGVPRDGVAMMVGKPGSITHTTFDTIGNHLQPDDLLVVNTSATMPAAIDGTLDGNAVTVHISTPTEGGRWVIEIRKADRSGPILDARGDQKILLTGGGSVDLIEPDLVGTEDDRRDVRLWIADIHTIESVASHLARYGKPIRYGYVADPWPLESYQTVFSRPDASAPHCVRFASAEMPSAARPFTARIVADLARRGVRFAPIVLHAGVSSDEIPRPERFNVPHATAAEIERARGVGARVIAVGTTAARAIESAADDGNLEATTGWTDLVLGPDRPARIVAGILTGWHPPDASHVDLLKAVVGVDLVSTVYGATHERVYLMHEFGDTCLLLPR